MVVGQIERGFWGERSTFARSGCYEKEMLSASGGPASQIVYGIRMSLNMQVAPDAWERIEQECERLVPFLPARVSSILDIGCGNHPLIDIWLSRYYSNPLTIHLIDGDKQIRPRGKEQVNFRQQTIPWRDRNAAIAMLHREVAGCAVYGHPPDPGLTIPCDLIVSRRSWGHHYPISTYIDLADRSLREGGRIIVDIRNETDGLKVFGKRGFRVISDNLELTSPKCQRLALTR
jgi:hypothetical protein